MPRHFSKKVKYKGNTYDSQKELDFYQRYLEHGKQQVDIHPRFRLLETCPVRGYKVRGIDYTPDFVTYENGETTHVFDIKTSLSSKAVDSAAMLRFKLFTIKYNMPVEVVVPRAHDFKMTMFGWTTHSMLDKHVTYDIHGNMKINKNGQPVFAYYNVYKSVDYDIFDLIGR